MYSCPSLSLSIKSFWKRSQEKVQTDNCTPKCAARPYATQMQRCTTDLAVPKSTQVSCPHFCPPSRDSKAPQLIASMQPQQNMFQKLQHLAQMTKTLAHMTRPFHQSSAPHKPHSQDHATAGEGQPSWAPYPRKQPQARLGLTGHSGSACFSVPRGWIQKDIFLSPLQPFLVIFSLHNLSKVSKSLVQFLWAIQVLRDHHLLTNLNSLLNTEASCSQAFCRRLPIHSHSSLNYHIFLTEESF